MERISLITRIQGKEEERKKSFLEHELHELHEPERLFGRPHSVVLDKSKEEETKEETLGNSWIRNVITNRARGQTNYTNEEEKELDQGNISWSPTVFLSRLATTRRGW